MKRSALHLIGPDVVRKVSRDRLVEDVFDRDMGVKSTANAGRKLRRGKGVSVKIKGVIRGANFNAKYIAKYLAQRGFYFVARGHVLRSRLGFRGGSGSPTKFSSIHFTVANDRHLWYYHDLRWNHVIWEQCRREAGWVFALRLCYLTCYTARLPFVKLGNIVGGVVVVLIQKPPPALDASRMEGCAVWRLTLRPSLR
ncbi:unnamed protein product [Clonostachys byssicola]|uniref:Uncharacterized protein n=1 Tax=Clonostachys byssicola TaxID=160290 RepID=A0A9N9U8H5_9HYPO|nr:unnamed protein product [Clonostachys byssicola]